MNLKKINKILMLGILLLSFRTGITVQAADISFSPPLRGSTSNSSGFGMRLETWNGNVERMHNGVDLTGTSDTPIYAIADGIVIQANNGGQYCSADQCGNWVSIQHEGTVAGKTGITSSYLHLSKIEIKNADTIKQGQLIGYMGTTGMSTGVHLHFQLDADGRFGANPIDPTTIVGLPSEGETKELTGDIVEGSVTTPVEDTPASESYDGKINMEWKNPLVIFKDAKVVERVKGLVKDDEFSSETIVLANSLANKFYEFSNILVLAMVVLLFAFMCVSTILYLAILPRGGTIKMMDTFQKVTGIDPVVTRKGTVQVFTNLILSACLLFFVAFNGHLIFLGKLYNVVLTVLAYVV